MARLLVRSIDNPGGDKTYYAGDVVAVLPDGHEFGRLELTPELADFTSGIKVGDIYQQGGERFRVTSVDMDNNVVGSVYVGPVDFYVIDLPGVPVDQVEALALAGEEAPKIAGALMKLPQVARLAARNTDRKLITRRKRGVDLTQFTFDSKGVAASDASAVLAAASGRF